MSSLQIHTTYENPLTSLEALLNAEEVENIYHKTGWVNSGLG